MMNESDTKLEKLKQRFEDRKQDYDNFIATKTRERTDDDDHVKPLMPYYDEETDDTLMAVEDKIAVLTLEDVKQLQQYTRGIMVAQEELVNHINNIEK